VASDNVTLYSGLAEPLSNYSALPPKGFSMCGSMEPSHDDLYQMAVAHAELEGEDTHFDNEEDVVDIFWHDEESEEDPLGPTTISPTRSRSSRQQGVNVRTLRGPTGHAPSSSSRGRKLTKPLMDSSSQTIHALNSDNENDNNPSPNRTAYHIPVYFHLFLDPNNDNAGYLSRKDINRGFMKHLRQAFSRTNAIHFEFVGMTLTYNHNWFQCKNEHTYKSRTRRGGPETLNVFICDMAGSLGLGGNAHLPPTVEHYPEMDGVNIMNPALGGADFAYQAFVHEVGHWVSSYLITWVLLCFIVFLSFSNPFLMCTNFRWASCTPLPMVAADANTVILELGTANTLVTFLPAMVFGTQRLMPDQHGSIRKNRPVGKPMNSIHVMTSATINGTGTKRTIGVSTGDWIL